MKFRNMGTDVLTLGLLVSFFCPAANAGCNDPGYVQAKLAQAKVDPYFQVPVQLVQQELQAFGYRLTKISCEEQVWTTAGTPDRITFKLAYSSAGSGLGVEASVEITADEKPSLSVIDLGLSFADMENVARRLGYDERTYDQDDRTFPDKVNAFTSQIAGLVPYGRVYAAIARDIRTARPGHPASQTFYRTVRIGNDKDGGNEVRSLELRETYTNPELDKKRHSIELNVSAETFGGKKLKIYRLDMQNRFSGPYY